jgi:hypothetical protein
MNTLHLGGENIYPFFIFVYLIVIRNSFEVLVCEAFYSSRLYIVVLFKC